MPDPRIYKTAAAFRRAFEERIGRISRTEQTTSTASGRPHSIAC